MRSLPLTARKTSKLRTYSTHARGTELLVGAYNYLDLTPKGRNEKTIFDWVRRHDEYGDR